jgi:hypothetical protein
MAVVLLTTPCSRAWAQGPYPAEGAPLAPSWNSPAPPPGYLPDSTVGASPEGVIAEQLGPPTFLDNPLASMPNLFPEASPAHRVHVEVGATIMQRTNGAQQILVIDEQTLEPVMTTSALDMNYTAGPYILAGVLIGRCGAIEASYWQVDQWKANASVAGDNNLSLPGDFALATFDFFAADIMTADFTSDAYNMELNYRHSLRYFSILAGYRHFSLDESFAIQSFDVDSGTSAYRIGTTNSLNGGQMGFAVPCIMGRFALAGFAKLGVYTNSASQNTFAADFDNQQVLRNFDTSDDAFSFLGEFGITGSYEVTRWMVLRGGYRVMWISGLALGPEQLDFTDTATSGSILNDTGELFLHGANLAVEFRLGRKGPRREVVVESIE